VSVDQGSSEGLDQRFGFGVGVSPPHTYSPLGWGLWIGLHSLPRIFFWNSEPKMHGSCVFIARNYLILINCDQKPRNRGALNRPPGAEDIHWRIQGVTWGLDHRRRLHRGSGKIAPVPAEQPGQKYHFAPVLFCPRSVIKCSNYQFITSYIIAFSPLLSWWSHTITQIVT